MDKKDYTIIGLSMALLISLGFNADVVIKMEGE